MSTHILAAEPGLVKAKPLKTAGGLGDYLKPSKLAATLTSNLSAQAFLISKLPAEAFKAGVVWFVPSTRELARVHTLLRFFLTSSNSVSTYTFPEDFTPWVVAGSEHKPRLLLVVPDHLDLALPRAITIKQHSSTLTVGEECTPMQLLRQLEAAGYQPGPLPDSTGWFIKQGGMVVVASVVGAWRLTWNGNSLEEAVPLNLVSNLAGAPLQDLTIPPHKLEPDPKSTLKHFLTPEQTLVALPPATKVTSHRSFPVDLMRPSKLFGSVPLFGRQWLELKGYLTTERAGGYGLRVLTSEPGFVRTNLGSEVQGLELTDVPQAVAAELEGFRDTLGKTVYLTDRELGLVVRRRPRASLAAFERLTPGDYLVHIDHGIGRFAGLTQQAIDGVTRDYFQVAYADEDKLYVPIEHTDRLSRYLGSPHPKIERLHNASWFQVTKKVKLETAAVAKELLALYAKRQVERATPWAGQPEEAVLAGSFPWPLTPDQLKAWAEICADLERTLPMDRLICGDVGFGKTELAVRTAARAVLNGHQVALLAPTTILAQQHFDTFSERLKTIGLNVGLVSRAQDPKTIRATLKQVQEGKLNVVVGTHRLLARDVHFHNLGLLIVDEEQRFGVKQKEELRALKPALHVLSLSATPIPRTLNLAVSALRDLSIISTPPTGRQRVATTFCPDDPSTIKRAVTFELERQGQVYYLVNHVADLPATEVRLKKLLPKLKVGTIHGRMAPKEVAKTMHAFDQGELELLLATTIIENGIDLPNVNTLIVEGAENFGLSDLYQLKGRVGRGDTRAFAYFLVSDKHSDAAAKRLEALSQAEDLGSGLTVALKDLELRGAGAILGKEQHGQVSAVGLHLYGQLLAQAVEELRTGLPTPTTPEVLLRLPLEGRIHPSLIPEEQARIQVYQRLAHVHEPSELKPLAEELIERPLGQEPEDRLLLNLLTLLQLKLYAERARLREVSAQVAGAEGQFTLRFLEAPKPETIERLTAFDDRWHQVEGSWQASHPLAAGAWIPWLEECLKQLAR